MLTALTAVGLTMTMMLMKGSAVLSYRWARLQAYLVRSGRWILGCSIEE
jgi:hypothetical protein